MLLIICFVYIIIILCNFFNDLFNIIMYVFMLALRFECHLMDNSLFLLFNISKSFVLKEYIFFKNVKIKLSFKWFILNLEFLSSCVYRNYLIVFFYKFDLSILFSY